LVKALPKKKLILTSIKLLSTKQVAQEHIDALNNATVRGVGDQFYQGISGGRPTLDVVQDVKQLVPKEYYGRLPHQ
jgi:hypothetical protein